MKWAVELSQFDISYKPRTAVKSQALADFVADFATPSQPVFTVEETQKQWVLEVDGASNIQGGGAGIVLVSPDGQLIEQALHCDFPVTNNEAEYEALIAGLKVAQSLGIQSLQVKCDSQLVTNQILGTYQAKDERMKKYLELVQKISRSFPSIEFEQIPRESNSRADALASYGSAVKDRGNRYILHGHIEKSAITAEAEAEALPVDTDAGGWTRNIKDYLLHGTLPTDKIQARKIRLSAARYTMINGSLFRKSISGPYQRCLSETEAQKVLTELHEGQAGNHSGGRSLAFRAFRAGYYWPSMKADAKELVKKCDSCQKHGNYIHAPAELLHGISSPWPFSKWGMDIVGPLPPAQGKGERFILLVTDYYTKWVEAEAFTNVTDQAVKGFVWKHILCRFGVPNEIVTDNGSQFISKLFKDFCIAWDIRLSFSTPRYPKANGQAEATNKTLMAMMKKRLGKYKVAWVQELPGVLWSYRTTPRVPTGQTPFSLVYGVESVLPADVGIRQLHSDDQNQTSLDFDLATIDEIREGAEIRMERYKRALAKAYNKSVRARTFGIGEWVLRRNFNANKLDEA